MKKTTCIISIIGFLSAISVATLRLVGQENRPQYHHYQLVDVGTFGGPSSWMFSPGVVLRVGLLNNQGTLTGSADTSAADSYCFWAGCYATHGFQWMNGRTTDLGALPGGIGSAVNWISANGLMVGIADNGQQDPLNPALPQVHAVLWQGGTMTDLGTFMDRPCKIADCL